MSSATPSLVRSGRLILGATAASCALLLGVWLALGRSPAPEEPPPAVEEPSRGGVQAAAVDPVRRYDDDDDPPPADLRVASAPAPPQETVTVEDRLRELADRPPPAPPDPAILTAQAARAEALPLAMAALEEALAGRRSALRRACGAGASPLYIIASFAADGSLSGRTVVDDGTSPAVVKCVHDQLASLSIAPPGVALTTRAKLDLR
jgi:hypothetical protein